MAKVKSFDWQFSNFEINHSARNECDVLCSFISISVYGADSLFLSRSLLDQSLKMSSNFFSEAVKDAKLLFSSGTF